MAKLKSLYAGKYVDVAASQTGASITTRTAPAIGDFLDGVLVIPETTGAGTIALLDGSTSVNIFVTGTLSNLQPFYIPIKAHAKNSGGWTITTGANVHVKCVGNF